MDPTERLKEIVGGAGEVKATYGGFEITVSHPTSFPWYKVIDQLIKIGHQIWIDREEGKIEITTKPKV
ncbi:MAG: hypothetical protein EHM36_12125 [Deltaproteobacteria bacterium]|nr:MAG: hypothetical protein EHM36_12125 [Deltaproteobacteria bacterium]